jgi:Dolichyl-phosphate-mannose-protein mannosyltransferase
MLTPVLLIAAGGLFTVLCATATGMLIAPRIALPAPVRFLCGAIAMAFTVFLALTVHAASLPVWLGCGSVAVTIAAVRRRVVAFTAPPPIPWYFRCLFAGYGAFYLIHAFAPEIQADAVSYHLALVSEYARLHSFSNRVEFYSVLPQGLEMLFLPAFAIGGYSAAKLVHFSFLIAAVSLIRHISHELGIADNKACCATALLLLAPVSAVTSTSAYTDMGLVASAATTLYLSIRWDRERKTTLLFLAGLSAGFCYAIKPTFVSVALAAFVFVVFKGKNKMFDSTAFASAATLVILPWTIRAIVLTGDPVAPFLSRWFPNSATTPAVEAALLHSFSAFRDGFSWRSAVLDYTIRGGNQGILGPAFLFLPLALLALRKRSGVWLLSASLLFSIPIVANTGTRFLLPAMTPAAIALVSVLPGPAALALVGIQMIGSSDRVIRAYETKPDWRLPDDLPWRAALRIEPEKDYLVRRITGFANDEMVERTTPRDARIFALAPLHRAWLRREILVYWESAMADRFLDSLNFAHTSRGEQAQLLTWKWTPGTYRSLRINVQSFVRVLDVQFTGDVESTVRNDDGNGLLWRQWDAGYRLEVAAPPGAARADVLLWPCERQASTIEAETRSGGWQPIGDTADQNNAAFDIRRPVTASILRSGYRYILISEDTGPFAPLAKDMLGHPKDWGIEPVAHNGGVWLLYISGRLG